MVVLILSILVALALPAYINQQKKAAAAQVQIALKDMANFQQSWVNGNNGYATSIVDLVAEGYRYDSTSVVPTINPLNVTQTTYCMEAYSARYPQVRGEFSSEVAFPVIRTDDTDPGICPN